MSFFKMMKPGTTTILSAVLLFVVITSIFFSLAYTVGKEKVNQFYLKSAAFLSKFYSQFLKNLAFILFSSLEKMKSSSI